MPTLDEITKEKQRVSEALARVDAQREKLTSQLSELEATERVLARYSRSMQARKPSSATMPTAATEGEFPSNEESCRCLMGQFPTRRNREFFAVLQGI
jgi:hypothetical protein